MLSREAGGMAASAGVTLASDLALTTASSYKLSDDRKPALMPHGFEVKHDSRQAMPTPKTFLLDLCNVTPGSAAHVFCATLAVTKRPSC